MARPDRDIIRKMLAEGRANALRDLMEEESQYSRKDLLDNMPGERKSREQNADELYTAGLALEHVRFVANYGLGQAQVVDNGKVWSSYPEAFDKWLQMGCLGLNREEIDSYIRDNPLV